MGRRVGTRVQVEEVGKRKTVSTFFFAQSQRSIHMATLSEVKIILAQARVFGLGSL